MVQDAADNEELDRKFREMTQTRNQADAMVHRGNKVLQENESTLNPETGRALAELVASLEESLKGDNRDIIETRIDALGQALAEFESSESAVPGASDQTTSANDNSHADDSIVDAEFEDVSDRRTA